MRAGSILAFSQNPDALRISCLLAAVILPSSALAKPADHSAGQLIVENYAAAAIRSPEPATGTAASQSVQDITLGSPRVPAANLRVPVADIMAAQFALAQPTQMAGRSKLMARTGPGLALARGVVRRTLAAPMTSLQSSLGACEAYPYRPSNMLKSENEAYRRILLPYVVHEACSAGIPVGLLDALIIQESRYNALAISAKGAIGLTQLMPETAAKLGANAFSVEDNIRGGAAYLRTMLDTFGGQAHLALAAYNAGPGAVVRYGGIPSFPETQSYVASVLSLWGSLSQ